MYHDIELSDADLWVVRRIVAGATAPKRPRMRLRRKAADAADAREQEEAIRELRVQFPDYSYTNIAREFESKYDMKISDTMVENILQEDAGTRPAPNRRILRRPALADCADFDKVRSSLQELQELRRAHPEYSAATLATAQSPSAGGHCGTNRAHEI